MERFFFGFEFFFLKLYRSCKTFVFGDRDDQCSYGTVLLLLLLIVKEKYTMYMRRTTYDDHKMKSVGQRMYIFVYYLLFLFYRTKI